MLACAPVTLRHGYGLTDVIVPARLLPYVLEFQPNAPRYGWQYSGPKQINCFLRWVCDDKTPLKRLRMTHPCVVLATTNRSLAPMGTVNERRLGVNQPVGLSRHAMPQPSPTAYRAVGTLSDEFLAFVLEQE